jgi:hypothetical protein
VRLTGWEKTQNPWVGSAWDQQPQTRTASVANLFNAHCYTPRMGHKRLALVLHISLVVTATLGAENPQAIRITPEAVFARYIQALGGAEAVGQVHTAHIKAELCDVNSAPALAFIDHFDDESGKYFEQGEDRYLAGWKNGYDGKESWFVSLYQGRPWRLTDANVKKYRYSVRYVGIIRSLPAGGKTSEVIGAAQLGASRAIVVRVPSDDGSSLYYFDGQTGLLVRTDIPVRWRRWGYEGKELKASHDREWGLIDTCYYKQYEPEPHSKVLFPRKLDCQAEGTSRTYNITRGEVNIPLAPTLFKEPPSAGGSP